ncbi:MAG: cellulose biosynthesis cyclic di-GMP-binding regulatory protein BcsB [Pseudomonadota bacterium]
MAWPAVDPASAQSPFTIRTDTGQAIGNIPTRASPSAQRREAERAAAGLSPENPQTQVNAPSGGTQTAAVTGPAPFDVNDDGVAVPIELPEDEEILNRPSTTTSPLSTSRSTAEVLGFDAVSPRQVEALNGLLRRPDNNIRELRVAIENDQEFVTSIVDRPIATFRTLRMDGELATESFQVFLGAAEAARGGTLSIAFTNSVLVLPEASQLRVYLNGRQVAQTAIDSPDRTKVIALPVDSALMRPGANAIRLEADMRHRIDCSLDATYELWTRIDTRLTGITFGGGRVPLAGLNDLPAVGVGTNGATRIRVIQANPANPTNIDRMLRAVQAAALRGRFVQPLVEVVSGAARPDPAPGVLNIVIGTYDQVVRVSSLVPRDGASEPAISLVDPPDLGATIFITGPTPRAVDAALSRFDMPSAPGERVPSVAAMPPWLVPEAVRVDGGRSITLRQAGVDTINFSGRRFSAGFQVALPTDFFAAAYGEADLLLDAAYSSAVEPGSRLSVFVNGVLSTAISFTSSNGLILEDFPIVLVMEQFRPGLNSVEIVADLETREDRECLPGGTVPPRDRFALFSSTRLVFPDFARVGQVPNLASFAANGFPYGTSDRPVRVRIGGTSPDTIGAAGTLLARVAVSRGAPLITNVVEDASAFPDDGVIVVAPFEQASNLVLETTGVDSAIPSTWLLPASVPGGASTEPEGLQRYDDVLRRLRQQLRQEELDLARDWASAERSIDFTADSRAETQRSQQRWFDEMNEESGISRFISNSLRSLREAFTFNFATSRDANDEFAEPLVAESATVVLAQGFAPGSSSTAWTLVTAPSPALLSTSVAAMSAPELWNRIGGRLTAYSLETNEIQTIAPQRTSYLATLPLSFSNLRLIAANWFSINNGVYALSLVAAAVFLGFVTFFLIGPLGRSNRDDRNR